MVAEVQSGSLGRRTQIYGCFLDSTRVADQGDREQN